MWKQNYRCFCVWRSELINNFSNFTILGSILAHFPGSLACLHSECRTPDDTSGLYFLCGLIGIFAPIWFVDLSAIVGLLPGLPAAPSFLPSADFRDLGFVDIPEIRSDSSVSSTVLRLRNGYLCCNTILPSHKNRLSPGALFARNWRECIVQIN